MKNAIVHLFFTEQALDPHEEYYTFQVHTNTHLCISEDVSQDNYGCSTMNSLTHDSDEFLRLQLKKQCINKKQLSQDCQTIKDPK